MRLLISFLLFFSLVIGYSQGLSDSIVIDNHESPRIGCFEDLGRMKGRAIINSQEEYENLIVNNREPLNNRITAEACGGYQFPIIDFSKKTLIYYYTGAGGCQNPKIEKKLIYFPNQKKYIFRSIVTQYGACRMLTPDNDPFWLVDKLKPDEVVLFEVRFIYADEIRIEEKE